MVIYGCGKHRIESINKKSNLMVRLLRFNSCFKQCVLLRDFIISDGIFLGEIDFLGEGFK